MYRVDQITPNGPVVLLERTRDPRYDAARALEASHPTATLVQYFGDRPFPSFQPYPVAKLAKQRIEDAKTTGPRLRKWYPTLGDLSDNA